MCLVAAELERQGIATVCLQLLDELEGKIDPPRALRLPFRHGYPLDRPADPVAQGRVLDAAFRLLKEPGPGPISRRF